MATIRWCPIFPKWDMYQPLKIDDQDFWRKTPKLTGKNSLADSKGDCFQTQGSLAKLKICQNTQNTSGAANCCGSRMWVSDTLLKSCQIAIAGHFFDFQTFEKPLGWMQWSHGTSWFQLVVGRWLWSPEKMNPWNPMTPSEIFVTSSLMLFMSLSN